MDIPRPEHPRPQFFRPGWLNLNGVWEFEADRSASGEARGLWERPLSGRITVPFCPESALSGVGDRDFTAAVWYRRVFELDPGRTGGRVILHFGAADYETEVRVNGKPAGIHAGGYSSFEFDITGLVRAGANTLTVRVGDDLRSGKQPRGKQSCEYFSHGCDYTRTTGIWQTVWLEFVPDTYLSSCRVFTDYRSGLITVEAEVKGCRSGLSLAVRAGRGGVTEARAETPLSGEVTRVSFVIPEPALWEPDSPVLYSAEYSLVRGGAEVDRVSGYFGIRGIELKGRSLCLNGKPLFMRLVLDQGFYPEGVCTAPTDAHLARDIELSKQLGFNGARLHQKVFEERFLYHADRLGYLVWGEQGSWGLDVTRPEAAAAFLPEWLEVLRRDFSHPCIIGWCPFNETWDLNGRRQDDGVLKIVYLATKAFDNTRPCIDTSGNYHVMTDIYDVHDYEQDAAVFESRYGRPYDDLYEPHPLRQKKNGAPFFVSEFGGARWAPDTPEGWGYGDQPADEEEVARRFTAFTGTLLSNPDIAGYCYTQLTDIEQERNGLYFYDRSRKFSDRVCGMIRAANLRKAASEEGAREKGD